jgi:EAL domain-containing protein (putative c-di-GMP-specific phosphodiesterase class I)/FixJ family two-component response regulator
MAVNMIMVVDDDEFQLSLMNEQLLALGWTDVLLAASGETALLLLDRYGPDIAVIISDLSMPGMDGLVLMRHLAQRGVTASFILLSSATDEILSSAAGLAQAHQFDLLGVIHKPCTAAQLRDLLSKRQPRSRGLPPKCIEMALTVQRLQQALDNDEFVPWYQPKVDMDLNQATSVEALARWPLESGGMIGPALFVPAIEAAGLSDKLFFSMARQVLCDLAKWRAQGLLLKAAINMSMDTAMNLEMPERLQALIEAQGLQPQDLIIEVTESGLMTERTLAMETLTRLSLMGYVLSIDDFGTGYSSLVQLVDLPFKELKIDAGFVQRADTEKKAEAVLRIAFAIGHSLGMSVISEGVENTSQMDIVRACGGKVVQGYLLARPMSYDTCIDWLLRKCT